MALAALALALAACGGNAERFQSADGSVEAVNNGGQWTITDSTGHELVSGYDSMRVTEVSESGHPMTVLYYKGADVLMRQFYSTMRLRSEGTVHNGRREGRWVFYHPNGQVQVETTYIDGKEEGEYRVLRDNGAPVYIGHYEGGRPTGVWEAYDQDGNLAERMDYNNGGAR